MRFSCAIFVSYILAVQPMAAPKKADAATPLHRAFGDRPVFGAAVPPLAQPNKDELRLLTKHFNAVTPENFLKPVFLQPQEGSYDSTICDDLARDARKRRLQVNGHTLVWHTQTPDWFFTDNGKPAGRELLLACRLKRVTFRGIHDGATWLNHFPAERTYHPLLWNRKLQPTPAFFAVIETARGRGPVMNIP